MDPMVPSVHVHPESYAGSYRDAVWNRKRIRLTAVPSPPQKTIQPVMIERESKVIRFCGKNGRYVLQTDDVLRMFDELVYEAK